MKKAERVPISVNRIRPKTLTQCHIPQQLATYAKWIALEVNDLKVWYELNEKHLVCLYTANCCLNFCQQSANQCVTAKAHLQTAMLAECANTGDAKAQIFDNRLRKNMLMLCSVAIETVLLLTKDNFSIQRLSVEIDGVDVQIGEKLCVLTLGGHHQEITADLLPKAKQSLEDAIYYFSPVIPQAFHLGVCNIEVSGMKGSPSPYTLSVGNCSTDSTFKLAHIVEHSGNGDNTKVELEATVVSSIDQVIMEINLLEAIAIDEFAANLKIENEKLASDVRLTSVFVSYHHEELMKWLKLNFKKPSSAQNRIRNATEEFKCGSNSQNGRYFSEAEVIFQMSHFTGKYYQSPRMLSEIVLFDLDYIKVKQEKSLGKRIGELRYSEIIVKNLWCHLGEMPSVSIPQQQNCHTWGSPLYVGILVIKNPKAELNPLAIQLSSIQVEMSPELYSVAPNARRCLVDLQEVISDFYVQKEVEGKQGGKELSSFNTSREMIINMHDCNVYLLDDHKEKGKWKEDSCYMLRFDNVTVKNFAKKFSYDVEGFKAITIIGERVGQHVCAYCGQLMGYWLHIAKLNGLSYHPFGEMSVELQEEVKMFWNQNLQRRFSSITSNINNFWKTLCHTPGSRNEKKHAVTFTINSKIPISIVVDLFEPSASLQITLCDIGFSFTEKGKCFKGHIRNLDVLKGVFRGLSTASIGSSFCNFSNGFIHHKNSNTFIYLSIEKKIENALKCLTLCHIIAALMYLLNG